MRGQEGVGGGSAWCGAAVLAGWRAMLPCSGRGLPEIAAAKPICIAAKAVPQPAHTHQPPQPLPPSLTVLASSVLPTPVGPRNIKDAMGRLGSARPARDRWIASATSDRSIGSG